MFCTQLTTPLMSVSEVDGGAADVDECAVFGGSQLCSHICVNTIGSFRCECERGHKLATDGRTCYRDGRGHWFIFLDILFTMKSIDLPVIGHLLSVFRWSVSTNLNVN